MKRHHKKILRKLSQQEAEILALRFGVKTEKPQTLQECGEQLGLDRQRVRQIEAEALRKLRYSEILLLKSKR